MPNPRVLFAVAIAFAATSAFGTGDVNRGREIAVECFACHGKDGNAPSPINPKIGGQHESYIRLALNEYKFGSRKESLMRGAVLKMSAQEIEDVAAYYAGQRSFAESTVRLGAGASARGPAGPAGPGGPGVGPGGEAGLGSFRVDKVERKATFVSLLAAAEAAIKQAKPFGADVCKFPSSDALRDSDADGLNDAFDVRPSDAAEFARDSNGDGKFEICSIQQMQAIVTLGAGDGKKSALTPEDRLRRSYELAADLDASPIENWMPIGSCGPDDNCMMNRGRYGFMGVLDGRGHTVRNLKINRTERGGVGLVGVLGELGMVINLSVMDAVIEGRSGTGAVVGASMGVVYRTHAKAMIKAGLAVGGLVGGSSGLVADSRSEGDVVAQQAAGGLVGDMTGGVVRSTSSVKVSGNRALGGLVGLSTFGMVFDSVADGSVTGVSDLGGLVGMSTDGSINNSSSAATVTGETSNIGGVVGFNSLSLVRNSFATGTVAGGDTVGGLVGRNNGMVRRSFATGPVTGATNSGPLVGLTVQGDTKAAFADLKDLRAAAAEWSPAVNTSHDLLEYYCDTNFSGAIEPSERISKNYIWSFQASGPPRLTCLANSPG